MSAQKTHDYRHAVGECLRLSDLFLQICGVALTPYQREYRELLIRAALSGHALIVPIQWSRQTGKTEGNVHTAIALAIYNIRWLQRNYPVAIITPSKQEQSVVVTRERLRKYADRLQPWLKPILGIDFALAKGRRTDDYIFVSSAGFEAPFHCVSASPSAFQKGQTYPLMFLEQIEDMDETVMKTNIFPFGAGSEIGAVIVLAGSATPKVANDYYFRAIQKQREQTGIRPPWFVDDELGAMYRPGYGQYLQLMKEQMGEESDAYRTQFGNIWIQPINKPFSRELLLALTWSPTGIPDRRNLRILTPPSDSLRAVGIDVAKDVDSTVVTGGFRYGPESIIDNWLELPELDYEKQADAVVEFIERGKYTVGKMDKNGPGNAFIDMVNGRLQRKQILCTLQAEPLTSESNNRIYTAWENELTHRRVSYPERDTPEKRRFFEQHIDALRIYGARSMMKLEAPSGRHDDYVASGALFLDAIRSAGPQFGLHTAVRE
jgi:hypothetical protein